MLITINMEADKDACGYGGGKTSRKLSEGEELKMVVESGYSSKAMEFYVNTVNVGKLEDPTVATKFLGS